jgi:hypothetical protein
VVVQNSPRREGAESGRGGPREGARDRARRRSFCFIERGGARWSVFLATYSCVDGEWRGYFTFRTGASGLEGVEVRTADVFVEPSEAEVDARARSLGRPLLLSLLESALHTRERREGATPDVSRWFRRLLAGRSRELVPPGGEGSESGEPTLSRLRSLYDSYRIDQVSHLVALMSPERFKALVEQVLEGREIDFRASDRLQAAMLVVQELERHLPLPPFELWAEDYLAHPEVYHRYSHDLHREPALPE